MDNCTLDCIELMGNFTQEGMCQFAQDNCLQDTVQIVQGYYCLVNSSIMILSIFSVTPAAPSSLSSSWSTTP